MEYRYKPERNTVKTSIEAMIEWHGITPDIISLQDYLLRWQLGTNCESHIFVVKENENVS